MNSSHARRPPQDSARGATPRTDGPATNPATPAGADASSVSAPSPARLLQGQLSAELSDPPDEKKWPKSATVAFVVVTCGAFWGAVYWAVSALMRK
jgi:hypothetical protein